MNELESFERQVQKRISVGQQQLQSQQQETGQRMALLKERQERFNARADEIVSQIVLPRMQKLADHFDHAELEKNQIGHGGICRFKHTAQFPATTTMRIAICHDEQLENLDVSYDIEILPVFMKYEKHDGMTMSLERVDAERLTNWVETKLLLALETYLRLQTAKYYQKQNLVTDPVCGMQISKIVAAAKTEYQGRTYYFCVDKCRDKFVHEPLQYVGSKTT